MTDRIIDYAGTAPDFGAVVAAGYKGIARYLAPLPNSKVINVAEKDRARAHGLSIVLVWETSNNRLAQGAAAGAHDAAEANRQADILGFPADRPIYYACDFDAQPGDFAGIEGYLRAAAGAKRPVGIYGGINVINTMLGRGAATYAWQTVAWSHGQRSAAAHLYQRLTPTLPNPGVGLDENECLRADYGQWNADNSSPTPEPPHVPTQGVEPMITSVQNLDGRHEFFSIDPNGRVFSRWEDGHGALSPWTPLSNDPGKMVALTAGIQNGVVYVIAENGVGELSITMQHAPGQGPWSAWVDYKSWLAFAASQPKAA